MLRWQQFVHLPALTGLFICYNATAWALETVTVEQVSVPRLRIVDATIEAVQQATVSAQTSGRILEITVDVDDYVEKGDVIMRLRDKEQRAALDAAQARFDEASSEYKRVREIYEKKLVAKAALDRAEAQLKATRAALDQARESFEHTRIRAPYSGIVVKRHVEVGETARPGQALMTGLSLEKLRARVDLPQSLIHHVRAHRQAWVWIGKQHEKRIKAESLTISPFADEQSHTFLVRVNLPDGDHGVYPGMHTRVAFQTDESKTLSVPKAVVARRSEVTGVYVVDEGNITFRYVRLGKPLQEGYIEITAGLSAGETVALDPMAAMVNLKSATENQSGDRE